MQRLAEAEHIGEVARLLSIFREIGQSSIGQRELVDLALNTAGLGHRYPRPLAALRVAFELKLIVRASGLIHLSGLGQTFVDRPAPNPTDVGREQGQILFALLLDHPALRLHAASMLRSFRRGEHGHLRATPDLFSWDSRVGTVAKVMQQCGALTYRDEAFYLNPEFEALIPAELLAPRGFSEEELYQRLEAQRERAAKAEELVVVEERKRVAGFGKPKLVERVIRISQVDVSAGYDIISVEPDETPRYIEVKSSTGDRLRFEWSFGERCFAADKGNEYWIYFVPVSEILHDRILPIFLIHNPIKWIQRGALVEEPTSWRVTDPAGSQLTADRPTSGKRLVELGYGPPRRR